MIRLHQVSKTYQTDKVETLALKDIDLHVEKSEFVCIMGPSGCGKSTLLNLITLGLLAAIPVAAIDLVAFTGITGPLTSALTQLAALAPGVNALVGFIGFVVALISLSALRNFSPVLFFIGLAIFGSVGLVIGGAIMGATI